MSAGERARSGVRLCLTTLTVLPVRGPASVDRAVAGVAMSLAPAVGAAVGLVAAGVGLVVVALGASSLVGAVIAVSAGVLITRGLHLDGLADTVDALGSYTDSERALRIMREPEVGPFGVAAIVLVLLAQVAGVATALTRPWVHALATVVTAASVGRLAITVACRRGVPAARPEGLGALVAGTVSHPAVLFGAAGVAGLAVAAVPGRLWQGPVAVALGLAASLTLVRHAVRRLGGITGDVLGASCELATTVTYLSMSA